MGHRIAGILAKHKGLLEAWAVPAAIVLVGLSAFGLGRLSVMGEEGPRLLVKLPDGTEEPAAVYAATQAPATPQAPLTAGAYVASKSGSKYYPQGCSAASRIKEANKVYFDTAASAEAAGYQPAANC